MVAHLPFRNFSLVGPMVQVSRYPQCSRLRYHRVVVLSVDVGVCMAEYMHRWIDSCLMKHNRKTRNNAFMS